MEMQLYFLLYIFFTLFILILLQKFNHLNRWKLEYKINCERNCLKQCIYASEKWSVWTSFSGDF